MRHVDGSVLPVPKKRFEVLYPHRSIGGKKLRKHGTLDYKGCLADEIRPL